MSHIPGFSEQYGFELDAFQLHAVQELEAGRSVLVAAPTGAGKTVVGEFACHLATETDGKCFYTTPIKALSNQKYRDLVERYGAGQVGLLTGDRSVNGEAPVVVMTTEVLRNMIYEASSTLEGLRYVVLDEVHYLSDPSRGAVWEEVIVQLRASVQIAALSATVSNAEEFGAWLEEVRDGGCAVVIEERRPVPLQHHYYVSGRIYPTFESKRPGKAGEEQRRKARQALAGVPNPKVLMMERRAGQRDHRGRRHGPRLRWPSRPEVVDELHHRGWLPAIMFVFSRNGCDSAVDELLAAGVDLAGREERERIREIADRAVAEIPDEDLRVLGFGRWREALEHGVAAHHAGLVPAFKEAIEQAFQEGLLRVVVATETLALGINMPAKCVVIERLEKWNGERHVMLTPGEYTQLTGRAGRRGIDPVGHAVVLYQRDIDFRTVAGLVGTRTYPLRSSFSPTYNMTVNLLRRHELSRAEELLEASFAQFQADRSVVDRRTRLAQLEDGMDGYASHLSCDRGDWEGFWQLRRELSATEKRGSRRGRGDGAVRERIATLQPGEVVHWPGAPRRGLAVVVGRTTTQGGTVLARVITEDRRLARLGPRDVDAPPVRVGAIELPGGGNARQPGWRGKVASRLRDLPEPDPVAVLPEDTSASERISQLREELQRHPCNDCPDLAEHERWQHRYDDLDREARRLRREIERATGSLVRHLHQLVEVLQGLGYLDDRPAPTDEGLRLAGIYADADLVIAESLRQGVFRDLDAAELAGLAALFVYESRSDEPPPERSAATKPLTRAIDAAVETASRIRGYEGAAGIRPLRELDPGFVNAAWRWAKGADLDAAIGPLELTGGDFVRNVKQVADLVGQIRDAAQVGPDPDPEVATAAARAVGLLWRGVVEA
ncbi:MAG: DEAD/DEAH box helicase [Actinobacteria bacterium]|nr:DEAD/DEAH box helicase [Actinomycetota bacterium]